MKKAIFIVLALVGVLIPTASHNAVTAYDFNQMTVPSCMWLRTSAEKNGWFEMNCYVNAGCLEEVCIKGKHGRFHHCEYLEQTPHCQNG